MFYLATACHVDVSTAPNTITLDLVNEACSYWQRRHPLLECRIHRPLSPCGKYLYTNEPRYFVRMNNADGDSISLNNVEILHSDDKDKWLQVVANELRTPLDLYSGPLWRLKVIVPVTAIDQKKHRCVFVFFFNHTITDGRNNVIFIELFNILAALIERKKCVEMTERVHSLHTYDYYLEQFTRDVTSASAKVIEQKQNETDTRCRVPTRLSTSPPPNETLPGQMTGAFECVKIEADVLTSLIATMKSRTNNVAKMSGLIVTVLALAYKQLLVKYGEDDIARLPVQYSMMCGVREKFGVSLSTMGNFSSFVAVRVEDELSFDSIWQVAERQTRSLHARLDANEEIGFTQAKDELGSLNEKVLVSELMKGDSTQLVTFYSYGISSVGILANTPASNTIIKARELYVAIPSSDKSPIPMYVRASTLDGALFFTFSYNESIFAPRCVQELAYFLRDIFCRLAAQKE